MNDHDSEIMAGILQARGLEWVDDESRADVVIVNTCVVREGAEERAIGRLETLSALKRKGDRIIAVSGCMAQKDGHRLLERLPQVDLVVGTRDLFKIGSLIDEISRGGERLVAIEDVDKPVFLDAQPVRRLSTIRALVTVMYGCNNFCTFCIVPSTRGRETSRTLRDVVNEVRRLADEGYREVMLLGQNVNSYYDRQARADFADLLAAVSDVTGIERVRFITSHPKDFSSKLIEVIANNHKICEAIHLPVQAGSNRVLRRMKRFYTKEQYLELVAQIRAKIPSAAITTDVIVGFPDETEQDFEETYDLLEKARWDSAFIFMYSPRPGTKAATWVDSVPVAEKKRRLQICLRRQEEISGEINRTLIGTVQQVLVENVSRRSTHELMGRTKSDKVVIFPGSDTLIGKLVNVEILEAYPHTLMGRLQSVLNPSVHNAEQMRPAAGSGTASLSNERGAA